MLWLYRILFLPALLLALPYYAWRMVRRGGYRRDFCHRFGLLPPLEPPAAGTTRIWVHAVSVGELLAARSLLARIARKPGIELVLTTTTSTGYALAGDRLRDHVRAIGYFPLDSWPCNALAWRRWQPGLLVHLDSDLWPEHLQRARRRGVPVLLVNARLSDRSFRRFQRLGPVRRLFFSPLTRVLTATEQDEARFRQLLAPPRPAHFVGNLKVDTPLEPFLDEPARRDLRRDLGFREESFVFLGASTWPGEEAALLQALEALEQAGVVDPCLLLVPRHAERRGELRTLLDAQDRPWHLRSTQPTAPAGTRIHLADTTGELRVLTQVAELAFIGKSLPPHTEGQTPIEAAGFGVPLLFGPGMSNFRDIARTLLATGAACQVADADALAHTAVRLAQDPAARQQAGLTGREWHAANRGATDAVWREIRALLPADRNTRADR